MFNFELLVELVDLSAQNKLIKLAKNTYQSFSVLGRETHFVTRFGFVEEISSPLQKVEH
jgi:hypothetical protein